jgi:uncharacterized transporter YbjL
MPDTSPRLFSAYLNINEESVANEKKITEIIALTDGQLKIESIQRGANYRNIMPLPDTILTVGDRLKVHDYPDRLKEYESVLGATLFSGLNKVDDEHPLKADKQTLAEIVIIAGSGVEGRTL